MYLVGIQLIDIEKKKKKGWEEQLASVLKEMS